MSLLSSMYTPAHGRLDTLPDELRARFEAWKLYRRTVKELNALSNRELADLGLCRSSIDGVAREAAYGA